MTIKCALCDGDYTPGGFYAHHPDNGCAIYQLGTNDLRSVEIINAAIEQARKSGNTFAWTEKIIDPRKPDECKFLDAEPEGRCFCPKVGVSNSDLRRVCPCASWQKGDNK